jgi:hypothetical protein
VDNNPIKYRDPTGHVKETPEQQSDEGSATIRIIIFITEGLGFIIQF